MSDEMQMLSLVKGRQHFCFRYQVGDEAKVLDALACLDPNQVGFYPPYAAAIARCAEYYGVDSERIVLTNGLDEGIMAVAVAKLRPPVGGPVPEAIVPEPAFEIFGFDTMVVGGRLVQVMPRTDFSFPLNEVLAAITRLPLAV